MRIVSQHKYHSDHSESLEEENTEEMWAMSDMSENPSWQKLYTNDRLRILYKGEIGKGKREQVELAAELIGRILSDSE